MGKIDQTIGPGPLGPQERTPYPVWSALYKRKPFEGFSCWTVVFGQDGGPPIEESLAFALARSLLEKDPDLEELSMVAPGTPWKEINRRQREARDNWLRREKLRKRIAGLQYEN